MGVGSKDLVSCCWCPYVEAKQGGTKPGEATATELPHLVLQGRVVNCLYPLLSLHLARTLSPRSFHFWIACLHLKFKQVLPSVFNYNLMVILLAFQLAFSFHITKVHPSYCVILISCYNGFIMQVPAELN